ncbi:GNAT family N-acetyltransferase [Actinokineospora bangkokensis]|uniref:N-acetyltransferase domain-containing protein n=1 Tax=Actinokineospora bangkokensis TaxID=1193682 RepID=A0A1Q9LDK8_9PSEU|nr:GNAT family N-acetyltransferase [Actinokineospora bangkokensis]OLR90094.1 hypothetical protein BJP25_03715 [Actinokineospora bangkokensis]
MSTTEALEVICAQAWPATSTRPLGSWLLRASGGYTGRANSALTTGSPGVPLPEALSRVVEFSAEHGIRPTAQVVVGSEWDERLPGEGWVVNLAHPRGAESSVLVSALEPGQAGVGSDVVVRAEPPAGWFEVVLGGPAEPAAVAVLTSGPRLGFAVVEVDGEVVGGIRGCVVEDYLHIGALQVREGWRRAGVARRLLGALDAWAGGLGVRWRVLQVATGNVAAHALYAGLGYSESHRYRYWVPGV